MRSTLTDLKAIDLDSFARHIDATSKWPDSVAPDTLRLVPQSILVPWGETINALRSVIRSHSIRAMPISNGFCTST